MRNVGNSNSWFHSPWGHGDCVPQTGFAFCVSHRCGSVLRTHETDAESGLVSGGVEGCPAGRVVGWYLLAVAWTIAVPYCVDGVTDLLRRVGLHPRRLAGRCTGFSRHLPMDAVGGCSFVAEGPVSDPQSGLGPDLVWNLCGDCLYC